MKKKTPKDYKRLYMRALRELKAALLRIDELETQIDNHEWPRSYYYGDED